MTRGELYRVYRGSREDPRNYRVFVVVSRQALIDSRFSTVVCAPIFSSFDGLSTQVPVGVDEGLKHNSSIFCDQLVSISKSALTHFIGTLSPQRIESLDHALAVALDLEH
ncbi:MAG: type II toxin-antitoxin system PemK/MazF family toxin [Candidatus Latescibacteria bacterium]|nr:type II toxin-antitoxin system PemK/MazF family toxin [Candidatus Latescibacterota bacterium]